MPPHLHPRPLASILWWYLLIGVWALPLHRGFSTPTTTISLHLFLRLLPTIYSLAFLSLALQLPYLVLLHPLSTTLSEAKAFLRHNKPPLSWLERQGLIIARSLTTLMVKLYDGYHLRPSSLCWAAVGLSLAVAAAPTTTTTSTITGTLAQSVSLAILYLLYYVHKRITGIGVVVVVVDDD